MSQYSSCKLGLQKTLRVAYSDVFRQLLRERRRGSESVFFAINTVPSISANIRKLLYTTHISVRTCDHVLV